MAPSRLHLFLIFLPIHGGKTPPDRIDPSLTPTCDNWRFIWWTGATAGSERSDHRRRSTGLYRLLLHRSIATRLEVACGGMEASWKNRWGLWCIASCRRQGASAMMMSKTDCTGFLCWRSRGPKSRLKAGFRVCWHREHVWVCTERQPGIDSTQRHNKSRTGPNRQIRGQTDWSPSVTIIHRRFEGRDKPKILL